jgi:hypothetical protein
MSESRAVASAVAALNKLSSVQPIPAIASPYGFGAPVQEHQYHQNEKKLQCSVYRSLVEVVQFVGAWWRF